jgi:hypothetical protein
VTLFLQNLKKQVYFLTFGLEMEFPREIESLIHHYAESWSLERAYQLLYRIKLITQNDVSIYHSSCALLNTHCKGTITVYDDNFSWSDLTHWNTCECHFRGAKMQFICLSEERQFECLQTAGWCDGDKVSTLNL